MWRTKEFVPFPPELNEKAEAVTVEDKYANVTAEGKEAPIFYQEAMPLTSDARKFPVLFLHGKMFSSQTWHDLGTLHIVAAMGHRAVAVDLPGYGRDTHITVKDRGQFLKEFIATIHMERPVIVSPSMSGSFALPYLLTHPESSGEGCSGYIPIAPVGTEDYNPAQYKACTIPVAIVYGDRDERLGMRSWQHLRDFGNCETFVMKDAGHACYVNQADDWHELLYNFLSVVQEGQTS